jgi:hypothetical protein
MNAHWQEVLSKPTVAILIRGRVSDAQPISVGVHSLVATEGFTAHFTQSFSPVWDNAHDIMIIRFG